MSHSELFCIDIDMTDIKRMQEEKTALDAQNRKFQKADMGREILESLGYIPCCLPGTAAPEKNG